MLQNLALVALIFILIFGMIVYRIVRFVLAFQPSPVGTDPRAQAIAALCAQRGMVARPVHFGEVIAGLPAVPGMQNSFVSSDGSTWACDIWASVVDGRDRQQQSIPYSMLVVGIPGLNLPFVSVLRKGEASAPLSPQGQELQLESIDFDDRFTVRATDRQAAVMLIDQGMMQWLLDCDQVSFAVVGNHAQALVRRQGDSQVGPVEFELLFKFGDGFIPRIPALLRTTYAAATGPTVPA